MNGEFRPLVRSADGRNNCSVNPDQHRGRHPAAFRSELVKRYLVAAALVAAAACGPKQAKLPPVQTATVTRRDVVVDAQANGVIEPIVITEVKSKASGIITKFPVQTGTHLKPGDLIVQVDTRDVQN